MKQSLSEIHRKILNACKKSHTYVVTMTSKKKICLIISIVSVSVLLLLISALLINTYRAVSHRNIVTFDSVEYSGTTDGAVQRLINGLSIQTISWERKKQNFAELIAFKDYIYKNYPLLHHSKKVHYEVVNKYSLLYVIKGSDPSLKPVRLNAHMDVVPTTGQSWDTKPFVPVISEGYIYGRGTLDDKGQLFGILEAVESLLKENYTFDRTIALTFSHDEEISGYDGARQIVKKLGELGYRRFEFSLDEGLVILRKPMPGVTGTYAMIGTSQKGYATANLSVAWSGGHASIPTKESAIGILAGAVKRVEDSPYPSELGSTGVFLKSMAPEFSFAKRVVLSNEWMFGSIIKRILSALPVTNAMIRTTAAITQFHAGIKSNVLSPTAWATINIRVHPSQTVAEAISYLKYLINDNRVKVEVSESKEPLRRSKARGAFGYDLIEGTVKQMYPDVVTTEGLMVAMTDSYWYKNTTDNAYLFSPVTLDQSELSGIHGKNERISVKSYQKIIEFYYRLLKNMKSLTTTNKKQN